MKNIIPISHLKNYSKVVRNVRKNRPVYLTRNGAPCYAFMDIEDYEELSSCRDFVLDLIGETFETNDVSDQENFKNADNMSNKMSNEFWETIRNIMSNNADSDTEQNTKSIQGTEPKDIWDVISIILGGLSLTFEALDRFFYDLYGVKIGAFEDNQKERIWR